MTRWVIVCLFGLLGAREGSVLSVGDKEYSLQQFYAHYPKKQWERADSAKRVEVFNNFIKRKLCILEAKGLSLESDPAIAVKIRDRSQMLLVNESYEQLVAFPLIGSQDIEDARMFARQEIFVSHILIGYSGAYLAQPPKRSVDDALVLAQDIKKQLVDGSAFASLAIKYSDDPGAIQNSGAVGWVGWGKTVSEFQSAAFRLDIGSLSDPVLTDFGYHLILVTDSRPSDYQHMSDEEYENVVINLAKSSIRGGLRGAAVAYDSLQIEDHGVYFNDGAILKIVQAYRRKQKDSALGGGGGFNAADLLESITDLGVVCVYGGGGFGARWFANKIRRIPVARHPDLGSEKEILSVFKTIILQDIAINNAYTLEIDKSFSFLLRKNNMVSDVLYNAYLKYLVNSATKPDSASIGEYYNNNMVEKYSSPDTVLIREIRVLSRELADSLLFLVNAGSDFVSIAQQFSLINPDGGGLIRPFSRNKNRSFFDAAMLLDPGGVSPVLSAPSNQFSIIFLEEKIIGKPLGLERVYSQIESLLTKDIQEVAKRTGTDGLFDKYVVRRHLGSLE